MDWVGRFQMDWVGRFQMDWVRCCESSIKNSTQQDYLKNRLRENNKTIFPVVSQSWQVLLSLLKVECKFPIYI